MFINFNQNIKNMATRKEEIVPVRSFAGILRFGKEQSKISIDKDTLIIISIGFSLLILALNIIFRYFI